MTTKFDLIFNKSQKGEKQFTPYANICIKTSMRDGKGNMIISPNLTASEIDSYIDHLIAELNEIRKTAKKKFSQK